MHRIYFNLCRQRDLLKGKIQSRKEYRETRGIEPDDVEKGHDIRLQQWLEELADLCEDMVVYLDKFTRL